jgi:hypothetical protein
MSATQDLIAAALRLTALAERNTDDRDEWQHSISEVREMCARAMVQPDMAEVERLLALHDIQTMALAVGAKGAEGPTATRTALLDYVRGFIAERDQFRDAAKMVPDANDPDPLHLSRILHELAGAASMCWTPKPSTAVFDSQQAIAFVEQAIAEIRRRMQMMSAAPQPVGEPCRVDQPAGWRCTRANGHKGPCAAVEDRA